MARILALSPDLMFGSRLQAMLTQGGHDVELCAQEDLARARAPEVDLLVVDLTTDDIDGAMLVESMRMGGELANTRTLAYYAHVDEDARRRARDAGFDLAVPRSRMAREGASLVDRLLAGPGSAPGPPPTPTAP